MGQIQSFHGPAGHAFPTLAVDNSFYTTILYELFSLNPISKNSSFLDKESVINFLQREQRIQTYTHYNYYK